MVSQQTGIMPSTFCIVQLIFKLRFLISDWEVSLV